MAEALKAAGKDYEYHEFEGGTHYLNFNANRLAAFEYMDAFLSKYLDGDSESSEKLAEN